MTEAYAKKIPNFQKSYKIVSEHFLIQNYVYRIVVINDKDMEDGEEYYLRYAIESMICQSDPVWTQNKEVLLGSLHTNISVLNIYSLAPGRFL